MSKTPLDKNTPMKEGLVGLKKKMSASKKRATRRVPKTRTHDMIHLDVNNNVDKLSLKTMDSYININDTTLNPDRESKLNLVFGQVINIQRGIDFALYPKLTTAQYMMPVLNSKAIQRLGKQRNKLPNYWAYIGYLVVERIMQDEDLLTMLLEDKPLINVKVGVVKSYKGSVVAINPVSSTDMYLGVVRAVVTALRTTVELSSEERIAVLDDVITKLKRDNNKSVFDRLGVKSEDI